MVDAYSLTSVSEKRSLATPNWIHKQLLWLLKHTVKTEWAPRIPVLQFCCNQHFACGHMWNAVSNQSNIALKRLINSFRVFINDLNISSRQTATLVKFVFSKYLRTRSILFSNFNQNAQTSAKTVYVCVISFNLRLTLFCTWTT